MVVVQAEALALLPRTGGWGRGHREQEQGTDPHKFTGDDEGLTGSGETIFFSLSVLMTVRGGGSIEHYREPTVETGGQNQSLPSRDPAAGAAQPAALTLLGSRVASGRSLALSGRCKALRSDF